MGGIYPPIYFLFGTIPSDQLVKNTNRTSEV
nr:MAG TPA: hypothetical protein [Caudoviricetes sp.]